MKYEPALSPDSFFGSPRCPQFAQTSLYFYCNPVNNGHHSTRYALCRKPALFFFQQMLFIFLKERMGCYTLKSFLRRIFCLKTVSCWKPSEGAELSRFVLSSIKIFLKINRVSGAQWRISSLLFEFRFQPNAGVYAPGHSFIRFKKKKKKIKLWTKSLYKWGFHIIIMSLSWTHTLLSCMHVTVPAY